MAKTTPWNITLFDDTLSLNDYVAPFNTHAADINAALNSAANGFFLQYATKAAMVAVPGTRKFAHASVYADETATNNGDYYWSGTAWTPMLRGAPHAMAAGVATGLAANVYTTVSFPTGRFSVAPIIPAPQILSVASGAIGATCLINNVTATSFQIRPTIASAVSWTAFQMTPTSAAG